jgi:hypothetical protein
MDREYTLDNVTKDCLAASTAPPGDLKPGQVPLFVVLGNDDNGYSGLKSDYSVDQGAGGTAWLINYLKNKKNPAGNGNTSTYDGANARSVLFGIGRYISDGGVFNGDDRCKKIWREAFEAGHEISNHTNTHPRGGNSSLEDWSGEITLCQQKLLKPYLADELKSNSSGIGLTHKDVVGFRAPYLAYNNNTFQTLVENGFLYDSSIEDGYHEGMDGTNYYWPYTLDQGTAANPLIKKFKGLWEIPIYPFIVPPDELCESYGVEKGLRKTLQHRESDEPFVKDHKDDQINLKDGRIRGLDYDLWEEYQMTGEEFLAVLKHSLDKRLAGNRAPMTVCMHTDFYTEKPWDNDRFGIISHTDRQKAMEGFIDYALTKPEVRFVTNTQLITWLKNPTPL